MDQAPVRIEQLAVEQQFDGAPPGVEFAGFDFFHLFGDMNVKW